MCIRLKMRRFPRKRNVFPTKRTMVKMRTWVSAEPTSKVKRQSRLRFDVFKKI